MAERDSAYFQELARSRIGLLERIAAKWELAWGLFEVEDSITRKQENLEDVSDAENEALTEFEAFGSDAEVDFDMCRIVWIDELRPIEEYGVFQSDKPIHQFNQGEHEMKFLKQALKLIGKEVQRQWADYQEISSMEIENWVF